MIKTVVREHHWSPGEIYKLKLGSGNYEDLEFWYDDILEVNREVLASYKKKKG